jgi:hypothetical protein
MPDFTYIVAVGRLGITAADGIDADEDPDTIWCDEGVVRFTPLNTYTKVAGGAPMPWTSGYLSLSGVRRARFIDLTASSVNPQIPAGKATHSVEFRGIKAQGTPVAFDSVNVRISSDTAVALTSSAAATALGLSLGTAVCDLTMLMPVPTAGGTPIVMGPAGPGIASLAVSGNNLVATLTSGDTKTTALPSALTDSDATTANRITTTGTATRNALDSVFSGLSTLGTLASMAPGGTFTVTFDGTNWKYNGATVTARPTARTDLTMMCINPVNTAQPSWAIDGDMLLVVS